jgi:hypothetical protein
MSEVDVRQRPSFLHLAAGMPRRLLFGYHIRRRILRIAGRDLCLTTR